MTLAPWLPPAVALLVALAGTGLVRRHALRSGLLDVPNARSMHVRSTPRGGGAAIVAGTMLGAVLAGAASSTAASAWLVAALAVALVGYVDDRRGLSPLTRMVVHGAAAALLVAHTGFPPLPTPQGTVDLGVAGLLLAWVAVVWSINLFNFMDGIDGLAATEAVFVFGAGAALALWSGTAGAALALVFAAAALGFLPWNWSPARIFMGDVGSGFLGYAVAVAALVSAAGGGPSVWTWAILYGAFLADATGTLVMRATRGERVFDAHRSHVYQRLARRLGSHRRATAVYAAVNLAWLLPLAILSVVQPGAGPWLTLVALAPLLTIACVAGRRAPTDTSSG